MLQSLAEKQSTYTQKWAIRRVVFEPTHRYLFYSEPLSHKVHEQIEVQDAIAACKDIHTVWKHKIKVTRVVRDVQLHQPPDEEALQSEDFDVRNLFILHIEGHRRRVRPEGLDKFASATHAAFDEASPQKKSKHDGSGFADAVSKECEADDDELSSFDHGELARYTFRFLSQSVFTQWFEKIIRQLELDGVVDSKYSVDCPRVDPRCQIPMARVPLHLVHSMHVLDQFVFYALVRGTRILLDDRKHRPLPEPTGRNSSGIGEEGVSHFDTASSELHLLRYQQAAAYDDPTYILVTDNVLYFVRKDGKVVWTLNMIDVEEVWFNTVATPEPFVIFKNRAPLADLVFLVHAPQAPSAGGSAGTLPSGYHDTTLYGHDGAMFLVQVLERLAPHAAAIRARGDKAVMSAPAFRQKQQQQQQSSKAVTPSGDGPFQCIGLNIFHSFEEYVREAANTIRWRALSDIAPSVVSGRAPVVPHLQVSPTPRWKLLRALQHRQRAAQGTEEDAEPQGKKGVAEQKLTAVQSVSIDVAVPVQSRDGPPPATAKASSTPQPQLNASTTLAVAPPAHPMQGDSASSTVAAAQEIMKTSTARLPKPAPILLPPSSAAMMRRPNDDALVDDATQTATPPTQLAASPASALLLDTLQRKPSNISAVMLSPEARPIAPPRGAAHDDGGRRLSPPRPPPPLNVSQEQEPFNDLLGLFSPSLRPTKAVPNHLGATGDAQPASSSQPIGAAAGDDSDILGACDSILLEDSLEIDADDL